MTLSDVCLLTFVWFLIEVLSLYLLIRILLWAAPNVGIRWPKSFPRLAFWVQFTVAVVQRYQPLEGHGGVFVWYRERFL